MATGASSFLASLGPDALAADVGLVKHRHVHNAEYRSMVLYESDVDREFIVATDEFFRAVKRIDEPVPPPLAAFLERPQSGLLRNDRNIRRQRSEAGIDPPVGGKVGLRER